MWVDKYPVYKDIMKRNDVMCEARWTHVRGKWLRWWFDRPVMIGSSSNNPWWWSWAIQASHFIPTWYAMQVDVDRLKDWKKYLFAFTQLWGVMNSSLSAKRPGLWFSIVGKADNMWSWRHSQQVYTQTIHVACHVHWRRLSQRSVSIFQPSRCADINIRYNPSSDWDPWESGNTHWGDRATIFHRMRSRWHRMHCWVSDALQRHSSRRQIHMQVATAKHGWLMPVLRPACLSKSPNYE